MSKIMVALAAGMEFPSAVKGALPGTIKEFAATEGLHATAVSGVINGSTPERQGRVREALARRLGVSREWIDEQADRQRQLYLERQAATAGASAS